MSLAYFLKPTITYPQGMTEQSPKLPKSLEFRIHGIGNHTPWSALGNPRQRGLVVADDTAGGEQSSDEPKLKVETKNEDDDRPVGTRPKRFVDSFEPPGADADIWLLNWARTSRRTARFAWFLAIPFTMVNVAGHMRPPTNHRRLAGMWFTASVHMTGLLVSVSAFVWLVVLAETVLKYMGDWNLWLLLIRVTLTCLVVLLLIAARRQLQSTQPLALVLIGISAAILGWVWFGSIGASLAGQLPWHMAWWSGAYRFVAGGIGVGLALAILIRALTRPISRAPWWVLAPHAAIVTAAGLYVAVGRPARWSTPDWIPGWATAPGPWGTTCANALALDSGYSCHDKVDVVTVLVIATTQLAVVIAFLLVVVDLATRGSGRERRPNLPGAALLLAMSVVLTHTFGSVARVMLDWVLLYARKQGAHVNPGHDWPTPVAFRTLTPYDDSDLFVYRIDLVVLGGLLFLVSLGLIATIVLFIRSRTNPRSQWGCNPGVAHWMVQGLGSTLAPMMVLALPTFALSLILLGHVTRDGHEISPWASLGIVLLVQLSALIVALLLAGKLAKARDILERFADIAGFWRVKYHPLAGASYRPQVLEGLMDEVHRSQARRAVVVAHSQGSVLAASLVAGEFEADHEAHGVSGTEWRLVTCGSPLQSLYGSFFPAEFDGAFLASVQSCTGGKWVNFWRSTDPIASEVPEAENCHLPDPKDPETKQRGHGDYWTDPDQVAIVRRYLDDD